MRRISAALLFAIASAPSVLADQLSPCEALGAARAVFVGEARQPVIREAVFSDGSRANLRLQPVVVERAFRGVDSSVMYITPAGTETYLTPGERYLVYGHDYGFTNIVMSSDMYGTKAIGNANRDLEFLDVLAGGGGVIAGVLELDESDAAEIGRDVRRLANVPIRLLTAGVNVEALTSADGSFLFENVAPREYRLQPQLSDDLALQDTGLPIVSIVSPGGCASVKVRVVPNGRIRGNVMTTNGLPPLGQSVALLPAGLRPTESDRYFQSVSVGDDGSFEFAHVRPGRYILGRLAFTLNDTPVAAAYYPGTPIRDAATVIVVGRATTHDAGAFLIPAVR